MKLADSFTIGGTQILWTVKVWGVPAIDVQTDNAGARVEMDKLRAKGIPAKLAVFDPDFFTPDENNTDDAEIDQDNADDAEMMAV